MGLVSLFLFLLFVGFVMFVFNKLVTIAEPYKTIVNAGVALVAFLYILQSFGIIHTNLHL